MKIKALLATLIGAVALQGATAGDWCPPAAKDKCPVECCDDTNGSVSFGYETDYIFYGQRLAYDSVWADANYTFDLPCVGLPLTVGVWHLSSLGSGTNPLTRNDTDNYGDETDLYASLGLPSICGFDHSVGYTHYLYPTTRGPRGTRNNQGDSTSEVSYTISREIFCGVTAAYRAAYDFTVRDARAPGQDLSGAWVHDIGLSKTFDVTDCLAIDLSGGALYTDNYFARGAVGRSDNTGWNNYYIQAALPIALSGCATLTPYIGYNGTPDGWVLDGNRAGSIGAAANANDVLHGGVSIRVGF